MLVGFTYPVSILFIPAFMVHHLDSVKQTWLDVSLAEKKRMGLFPEEKK
jgi:hypothetical protein